jgi:hypothetical protein
LWFSFLLKHLQRLPEDVLEQMDELLKEEALVLSSFLWLHIDLLSQNTKVVSIGDLEVTYPKWKVAVWKGDITTLEVDAIVNAANKYMLGTSCLLICHIFFVLKVATLSLFLFFSRLFHSWSCLH